MHILTATDFSQQALLAVLVAARWAAHLSAELSLVHVTSSSIVDWAAAAPKAIPGSGEITHELEKEAQQQLDKLRADHLAANELRTQVLTHISPAQAICEYADENGVDLVVLGTEGRTGLARMLIGSVAEKVVRHAPCSVLAVREGFDAGGLPKHMLVCTDFSEAADRALAVAAELAPQLESRVTLLHARTHRQWRRATRLAADADRAEGQLRESLESRHRERFPPPVSVANVIADTVTKAILQEAEKEDVDLVVVGSHGHTGARFAIGSVAERVTRHAPCPVFVARAH